ncbi:hypothetical protein L249_2864 [Ophiocordyceps polyrhachis-furcata BCC 54312]|uniref:Uncharacterized protein n=1 Tax=Ophiocordyceps polyrhachis-furcata BCC 54312 TaxID=1330021 RepID=A0A367LPY7_9HYPO|nr:hypothetical protein L249_2864 [Ophiocordyceps polyrhachis-furcata BCC 54312]
MVAASSSFAFVARESFHVPSIVPKTYFSGHHKVAMEKIKKLLPSISLVLECRDARIPLSTQNPHLERLVAGRRRLIIYTKSDLASESNRRPVLRQLNGDTAGQKTVFFWSHKDHSRCQPIVRRIRELSLQHDQESPLGMRTLIVGMPNVGKSSLLNDLRISGDSHIKNCQKRFAISSGNLKICAEIKRYKIAKTKFFQMKTKQIRKEKEKEAKLAEKNQNRIITAEDFITNPQKKKKVAKTGDQAGVTRKVGPAVRIWDDTRGYIDGGKAVGSRAAFMMDTPGIFMPYVQDGETMLKIALTNGIKTGCIDDMILVDYLLYHMNKVNPSIYSRYCKPTNDVEEFVGAVARIEGRFLPGGKPNLNDAAARILSRWREGRLGKFVLDDLSPEGVHQHKLQLLSPDQSMNQAKMMAKIRREAVAG